MASNTRDRIVDEAARLFQENGYEATGVATILRAAGVNSGSLYHFFSGKEDLLVAVLERHLERLGPRIVEPVEQETQDPLERVFQLLGHYRRGLKVTNCRRGCPVGKLAIEVTDEFSPVRALTDAYFRAWTAAVERWLDQAGNRLPAGLDRGGLAGLVLGMMQGGVMRAQSSGSLDPLDESVAQLRRYIELLELEAEAGAGAIAVGADTRAGARQTGQAPAPRPAPAPAPAPPAPGEPATQADDEQAVDRAAWRSW